MGVDKERWKASKGTVQSCCHMGHIGLVSSAADVHVGQSRFPAFVASTAVNMDCQVSLSRPDLECFVCIHRSSTAGSRVSPSSVF